MSKPGSEFNSIREYGDKPGFVVKEYNDSFELIFEKDNLNFRVTVAYDVLEWFIDIEDESSGFKFHDWADYTGYDNRPREILAAEMLDHLHRLFTALLEHEFRLTKGGSFLFPNDNCDWLVKGTWTPFNYGDT